MESGTRLVKDQGDEALLAELSEALPAMQAHDKIQLWRMAALLRTFLTMDARIEADERAKQEQPSDVQECVTVKPGRRTA